MGLRGIVLGSIYRHRRLAKRGVALLARVLPRPLARRVTALAERLAFSAMPAYQGDTLAPIFHYWSSRYLAPRLARFGLASPEDLYLQRCIAHASGRTEPLRILSLGSGAGAMELGLLGALRGRGIDARVECVDFNPALRRIAEEAAAARGMSGWFTFAVRDCNAPVAGDAVDVVIVNQFFHHVEDLERFCGGIRQRLQPDGLLLTSDVVGRNGHVLWPTVEAHVQEAWRRLRPGQRFDRYFAREQPAYVAVDHSAYSNEGIRAQDVVGALLRHFDFELFLSFGARIVPFVERRVGFNFSADDQIDRDFIDDVARADESSLAAAEYPASNMLAVLRHKGRVALEIHDPVSPEEHVRLTLREAALASPARAA